MNERFKYLPVGLAVGTFLAISFAACVAWDAVFPDWAMRSAWAPFLPGFQWLSVGSFFLGLVESFAYGFWLAMVIPTVRWVDRRFLTVRPLSST
ncbi:MAG: hypothetical protein BMS9Abin07_2385 [Acidimicrobiia bacterium]|nr:MAG: hypothetical protein BMS9Abin07_2385 [Acidimicrobiia bacterium]